MKNKNRRNMFHDEVYQDDDGLYPGQVEELVAVCISDTEVCEQLEFYRSVISPFIESYWVAASNLTSLIHQTLDYNLFINQTIDSAKDNLRKGFLLYRKLHIFSLNECYLIVLPNTEESVSLEPIKNCFLLFQNQGIIKKEVVNGSVVVGLSEEYDDESAISQVIINIEKFKK